MCRFIGARSEELRVGYRVWRCRAPIRAKGHDIYSAKNPSMRKMAKNNLEDIGAGEPKN